MKGFINTFILVQGSFIHSFWYRVSFMHSFHYRAHSRPTSVHLNIRAGPNLCSPTLDCTANLQLLNRQRTVHLSILSGTGFHSCIHPSTGPFIQLFWYRVLFILSFYYRLIHPSFLLQDFIHAFILVQGHSSTLSGTGFHGLKLNILALS